MAFDDPGALARLRMLLHQTGVNPDRLQLGVANGVAYLGGRVEDSLVGSRVPAPNPVRLAARIDTGVSRLPGIRSVVMRFDDVVKDGVEWRRR